MATILAVRGVRHAADRQLPWFWNNASHQVRGLNRACGLVGYPNVGKSTTFNAFVGTEAARAENFPFCTIEPNIIKVGVPDARLNRLAEVCNSAKVVPGMVEIRDIAGLIKGASAGAGMGNAFLSQIRGVQVVLHVVRCFSDPDVVHVEDPVDINPVNEYEDVLEELIIADFEMASRRLPSLRKKAHADERTKKMLPVYEAVLSALGDGLPASTGYAATSASPSTHGVEPTDEFLSQLITAKPSIVLANVLADDAAEGNEYTDSLESHIRAAERALVLDGNTNVAQKPVMVISPSLEFEIAQLDNEDDVAEYLECYGLEGREPVLQRILRKCRDLLGIISYLTVGDIEARAWFVRRGSSAQSAAGAIHSGFVKNFQQVEIWNYEDVVRLSGKKACKMRGRFKSSGKDYIVQDGDILEFRIKDGRS